LERTRQAAHPFCIVCGRAGECGLGLRFSLRDDGGVEARFECRETLQGYTGMLHGGITRWACWSWVGLSCPATSAARDGPSSAHFSAAPVWWGMCGSGRLDRASTPNPIMEEAHGQAHLWCYVLRAETANLGSAVVGDPQS